MAGRGGARRVARIDAPTPWVWLIARAKASPATYAEVNAFQDALAIAPLSAWPGPAPRTPGTIDPAVDDATPPLRQVFALDAGAFFAEALDLLAVHPPHPNDHPILARLARLGMVPGAPFDLAAAPAEVRPAIEAAVPAAIGRITARQRTLAAPVDGWISLRESMGAWGTNYLRRAYVDLIRGRRRWTAPGSRPACAGASPRAGSRVRDRPREPPGRRA